MLQEEAARFSSSLRYALVAGLFMTAGVAAGEQAVCPNQDPARVKVSFVQERLAVEARDVTAFEIAEALRCAANLKLHLPRAPEGRVSISISQRPLQQALESLFGREAGFVVLRSDREGGRLDTDVWVLGKVSYRGAAQNGSAVAHRDGSPPKASARDHEALLERFARAPDEARQVALDGEDEAIRQEAIAFLGKQGDPASLDTLASLMRDPDPAIQSASVDALGPLAHTNPHARAFLMEVVETVKDPELQLAAAEFLGLSEDQLAALIPEDER